MMLACHKSIALLCSWACTATALRTPNPRTRPPVIARRGLFQTAAAALAAVTTKPAAAVTTVAAAKAALLKAIPATATGAPATNATLPRTVSEKISACADALDAAASMKDTASNKQLDGSWRLVYSDAPEFPPVWKSNSRRLRHQRDVLHAGSRTWPSCRSASN